MKTQRQTTQQNLTALDELLLTQKMMRLYYWKVFFNPSERRDTRDLLIMLRQKVQYATTREQQTTTSR